MTHHHTAADPPAENRILCLSGHTQYATERGRESAAARGGESLAAGLVGRSGGRWRGRAAAGGSLRHGRERERERGGGSSVAGAHQSELVGRSGGRWSGGCQSGGVGVGLEGAGGVGVGLEGKQKLEGKQNVK
ncbi:hypothetical protein RHMOL_Rhmol05G0247000 [Rhododendron molle]|uniref:Uncharacterized protein n=1 Tax=Rhododendron molle TaxID=49168 RepID=A0ACC0NTR7_RHOML|nr:hypothetical protein RHMOL_Rhmol05G0247000 [Rhododendron molle]